MMKGDADATVRSNAVSAAADRPYSDRLAQGVDWSARRDPEARIRYASLGVLVRWQQSAPAVRGTIALLAATDGNDEIRRAAARALNGTFGRSP
jgi:hypothetical protein